MDPPSGAWPIAGSFLSFSKQVAQPTRVGPWADFRRELFSRNGPRSNTIQYQALSAALALQTDAAAADAHA
jgi:hypothetical protein